MTMPAFRDNIIPMLICHMANQCTKFEVFSFSHSSDTLGGLKILMDHITIMMSSHW